MKWISADTPPQEGGEYLVIRKVSYPEIQIMVCSYNTHFGVWGFSGLSLIPNWKSIGKVYYWMPIPELPEEYGEH